MKLYLEGSEIIAQFSVADPLPDDLNNVIIVHDPTSFFYFIDSFDELSDKMFERHCSFVSILGGLNCTLGLANLLLLHGNFFIPITQHFDVSSAIVLLDVWLHIGECIICISNVAEDDVVHRRGILLV